MLSVSGDPIGTVFGTDSLRSPGNPALKILEITEDIHSKVLPMLTPYDTGFSIGSAVTGAVVGVTQSVGQAVSEHLDFSQWMKSGSQKPE